MAALIYCLVLTGTKPFLGSEWMHSCDFTEVIHCSTSEKQLEKLREKLQPEVEAWNSLQVPDEDGHKHIPNLRLEIREFDPENEPDSLEEEL